MIWLRGPTCTGLWWYWLLGSGIVRYQDVFLFGRLCRGWKHNRLCIHNNDAGGMPANRMARLWCRSISRPKLPPKRLRDRLEKETLKGTP
jgi:hypothetical protein